MMSSILCVLVIVFFFPSPISSLLWSVFEDSQGKVTSMWSVGIKEIVTQDYCTLFTDTWSL